MYLSRIYFKLLGISAFLTEGLSSPLSAGPSDLAIQPVQKEVNNHPSRQSDKGLIVREPTCPAGSVPVFCFPSMTAPACIGREILYVGAVLSVVNSEAIHNMANLMKDWVLRKWGFYDYKSNEPTRRGIIGYGYGLVRLG
ncbi:hypothetical protein WALSEDRAFT_62826 [Wallemia mellicola CBS 633.66]|uniref:Uncharacterized protein n=1 Tax=Wallemia mellicola (strain ATCC MYA-4683 / CBS 633.66) TaxID=671144 RepID=I4YHM3_WALMC|nr:hypothetical protein WALSEDRAFT_62826 [Wallemia mellicola CBS 633.66]EIM23465.1 hypothetical protein WALSEDRAFT_62826 [Wallemia mellicola CBS 633.66]|eukprot:XP_006956836.1 hypothetical protein WALSEDRAFT_62826 [Wallemia mellicola CBS 633.66]